MPAVLRESSAQPPSTDNSKWVPPKGICLPKIFQDFIPSLHTIHKRLVEIDREPSLFQEEEPKHEIFFLPHNTHAKSKVPRVDLTQRWAFEQVSNKRFWISTGFWPVSQQKMTHIASQIIGMPLKEAIVQMYFSLYRPARYIHEALIRARDIAEASNWDLGKVKILNATTGRGKYVRKIDIKARGRHGIIKFGESHARICLKLYDAQPKKAKREGYLENYVRIGRPLNYDFPAKEAKRF